METLKRSKKTEKFFAMLDPMGINDEAHRKYLEEECDQLDLMNAWADFMDAARSGRKSVNPDNLLVDYLLGISSCDPMLSRAIVYDPCGIVEPHCTPFTIVFDDESEVIVHSRTMIQVEVFQPYTYREPSRSIQYSVEAGIQALPIVALRPNQVVIRNGQRLKIFMIIPAKQSPNPKDSGALGKWKSEKTENGPRQYAEFDLQEFAEKFVKALNKKGFNKTFCEQRGDKWIAGFNGGHSNTFREVLSDEPFIDDQGLMIVPQKGIHHWVETNEFPDIDVDYPPNILDQIIPWAKREFGDDHVVGVATYQRFGMKSSFKDVCRVHGIPLGEVLRVAEAIPDEVQKLRRTDKDFESQWQGYVEDTPEIMEFLSVPGEKGELHQTVFRVMKGLQGKTKTFSQHASAMIISRESLDGAVPMVARNGVRLSSWAEGQDRTDLSKFGQVKFDRLGLQTLMDRNNCMQLIYDRGKLDPNVGLFRRLRPDFATDPEDDWMFTDWTDDAYLEDPDSLKAAAEGRTIGCFQFESPGIRAMLREIGPSYFEELVAANAMYRPGVLRAKIDGIEGGDKAFIARKRGEIKYHIPEPLKPYLGPTYGLLVYQEQVMKVLEIAGGIPATDCEVARKAISKKKTEVLNKYRELFKRVAPKTVGWSEEEAAKYFDENIVVWSGYGFNRCIDPMSKVEHEDGTMKSATDCHVGDRIKAYDPETNQIFYDEVVDIHQNGIKDLFEVTLSNGSVIRCTMDHELVCVDRVKRKLFQIIAEGHQVLVDNSTANAIEPQSCPVSPSSSKRK